MIDLRHHHPAMDHRPTAVTLPAMVAMDRHPAMVAMVLHLGMVHHQDMVHLDMVHHPMVMVRLAMARHHLDMDHLAVLQAMDHLLVLMVCGWHGWSPSIGVSLVVE